MRIKEIINKILFKYKESLDQYMLVIIDRKSNSGVNYIQFTRIKHVDNNYLYIESEAGEDIVIPVHRVIRIEKNDGEIIWTRI